MSQKQQVVVTALHIYPVKSCKGITLQEAELSQQGLENDRRWLIVFPDGLFATQRRLAKMALIETALTEQGLLLSAPDCDSICIPYDKPVGEKVIAKIWGDECETIDEGAEVAAWVTKAAASDKPLRLVRMASLFKRVQSYAEVLGEENNVEFADAAPFLVTNESSLESLNDILEEQGEQRVPMNRFRPNIVVRGLEGFEEHVVQTFMHERYQLNFRFPCERCIMTTIDQKTAVRHPSMEPFKTIKAINPSSHDPKKPAFGHYITLAKGLGEKIRVGDVVSVV